MPDSCYPFSEFDRKGNQKSLSFETFYYASNPLFVKNY